MVFLVLLELSIDSKYYQNIKINKKTATHTQKITKKYNNAQM